MSKNPTAQNLWALSPNGEGSKVVNAQGAYVVPGNAMIAVAAANGVNTGATGSTAKVPLIRYFRAQAVDKSADGTTILSPQGNFTAIKSTSLPFKNLPPGSQYIAVPIATTPTKTSNLRSEPTILPKALAFQSPPMILNSPHRMVSAQMINHSPRGSQIMSPNTDKNIWNLKRTNDDDFCPDLKRKRNDKGGKGLRHFSMKVCEKVQKKGTTSYNEVADELVAEFTNPSNFNSSPCDQNYDQKNIRRRVYDALNVLMAMNIISKEKKEIKWLGLPTNSAQECQNLELEKNKRLERLRLKNQQIQDLVLQHISFKNLVERNKTLEIKDSPLAPNSAIQLPFIIVNTNKKTVIDCSISSDKSEYLFTFDNTFEIHDDIEVLKRMGLAYDLDKGSCDPSRLEKARKMVPKALEPYVLQMANGGSDLPPGVFLTTGTRSKVTNTDLAAGSSSGGDLEVERIMGNHPQRLSRQSSIGSSSDLLSRPDSSSASEDFSEDSDSESG